MIVLRSYQERAIDAVREQFRSGKRRVLLVAPTGFGKTATASVLIHGARARGHRVLFLVHRREILAETKIRLEAIGLRVGMVLAGAEPDDTAEVQLASIQTITARRLAPDAQLVVWDEAHHCAAKTYAAVAELYPDAWHLGLTATPMRADGAGLGDAFDALVEGTTVAELTADGYLAPCDAMVPLDALQRGEDVGAGVLKKQLAMHPCDAITEHASGRRVVVFQRFVDFSRACVARGGARWGHIDGATPRAEREAVLARFASGALDVVSNVFVLTEGWDAPDADCVVLARSFTAPSTYLQAVGRVLRVPAGRPDKRALIIDLGRNITNHGMPADEREFSLGNDPIQIKSAKPRLCAACGAVRRDDEPDCWACGAAHPVQKPIIVASVGVGAISTDQLGRLAVARLRALDGQQADDLENWRQFAASRGYKSGWAAFRFKRKYGAFPPWNAGDERHHGQ